MAYFPIQWARSTISGRQDATDGSRLLNFFASRPVSPDEAKSPVLLYGCPGFAATGYRFGSAGSARINGLIYVDSPIYGRKLFGVANNNRLRVLNFSTNSVSGSYLLSRAVPSGPLRMASDGRLVAFVSANEVYCFDQGKDIPGFVNVTAPTPDDPGDDSSTEHWVDIVWIDGYFILGSQGGQIFHSQLYSFQFDELDFARADSEQDSIVGMITHSRLLYVFGTDTIELWYNAGLADFAFARDNSFSYSIGAASRETIQKNEGAVIFLGSDLSVYTITGRSLSKISNEVVDEAIRESDASRARAFTYTEEGHKFYSLSLFSSRGAALGNWTFDFSSGLWHERTTTDVLCIAEVKGTNYVGIDGQNNVFTMDLDNGLNSDGSAITREAVSPILYNQQNRMNIFAFQIDIDYKSALGESGQVLLEWSDNGKKSWAGSGRGSREIAFGERLKWTQLGQIQSNGRHFRISTQSRGRMQMNGAFVRADVLAS